MRRLPFASLLAPVLLAGLLAVPAAAADRFGARTFRTGDQAVVVDARGDVFAVRFDGKDARDVGVVVNRLLQKVDGAASLKRAWTLRPNGLLAVTVASPLSPAQLQSLAVLVEAEGGHLWPALTRPGTGTYNRAFSDDQLIVSAAAGQGEDVLQKILQRTGGTLVTSSKHLKDTYVVAVGAAFHFDAVEAAAALSDVGGVVSVEPNLYRELALKGTVNDPLYPTQWHLSRNASQDVPGEGTIHADLAWDLTKGDPDVVVAVFDSGADWNHPDLLANVRQDLMFDASSGDEDPQAECQQGQDGDGGSACGNNAPFMESHGTAVGGVIAAVGDNDDGLTGVCPQCTLAPVRLLGEVAQSAYSIAEAFSRACDPDANGSGQGAWIINNSWGPGFSLFFPLSQAERAAFATCRDVGRAGKGTVIVFAAGNETSNVASDAYAKHPYVLGVAASTNLDDWAAYSNFGAEIDVAAPSLGGVVNEDNFGIVTTDVRGDAGYSGDDYTDGFSGTSAASPVVAGLAGLILSANPDLSAEQVRLVMTSTADKIRADKVPWEQFFGQDLETLFDYDALGHSIAFGYGRINAARAVALAADDVALAAALGTAGARCDDMEAAGTPCAFCSPEGSCLNVCATQDDCVDGSVCNAELGACELPRIEHTAFLEPCNADCTYCVPTIDTEFNPASICSTECTSDASCDPRCADGDPECTTDSFDCRPITDDPLGVGICAVGSPDSGGPADFNACGFNSLVGVPTLVLSDEGKELCGESCFLDENGESSPGACPYGFHCANTVCECTRENQNGNCRELTCEQAQDGIGDGLPLCVPNPGHADVCKSDFDCQRGDYCALVGDASVGECRFDDRAGCDICQGCADSSECAGRGACLGATQESFGVCTVACDDGERCPDGSTCRTVSVPSFGGRLRQFQACLGDGGDPDDVETSAIDACGDFVCDVPECRDDNPCAAGQVCVDGSCEADVDPAEGEGEPSLDDLRLGGGGPNCGGCNSSGDVGVGAFAVALLALLKRRRR